MDSRGSAGSFAQIVHKSAETCVKHTGRRCFSRPRRSFRSYRTLHRPIKPLHSPLAEEATPSPRPECAVHQSHVLSCLCTPTMQSVTLAFDTTRQPSAPCNLALLGYHPLPRPTAGVIMLPEFGAQMAYRLLPHQYDL